MSCHQTKVGPNLLFFLLPVTGEYLFIVELPPLTAMLPKQGDWLHRKLSLPGTCDNLQLAFELLYGLATL